MNCRNRKITAAVSALIAVLIVFAAVAPSIVGEAEEPVQEAPALGFAVTTIMVVFFVMGAVTGYAIHEAYDKLTEKGTGDTDSYVRGEETKAVAQSILSGLAYYDNALANYSQIWPLTNEHHIRQAEITSAYNWGKDLTYDPSLILDSSGFYTNASYMLRNAAAQVNSHFDNLNERIQIWNGTDTYRNMMNVEISYGLDSISSKSSAQTYVGTAVDATSAKNKVYITGGDIWVFGGSAVISSDAARLTLNEGRNSLDSMSGFSEGVYTLQSGRSYAGGILPVVDANPAALMTSLVLKPGNDVKLAKLTSQGIIVVDVVRDKISITIHPDGAESKSVDITELMTDYDELLKTIRVSITKASNAAATVWNIFDKAGEANFYLTTLMMPDNYDNISITQEQQEILTVLAMEQLSDYYSKNDQKIKTGDYSFSKESLTLYVRGDLYTSTGDKLYENVIFTPFVYGQNFNLNIGKNTLNQPGIMAVWSTEGTPLSSWNAAANMNDASLVNMSENCMLDVYEMYYDNAPSSSVSLEVTKLKLINSSEFPDPDPTDSVPGGGLTLEQIVKLICIIAGLLMIIGGLLARFNWTLIIAGAVIIIGGLLLAGPILGLARFL